MTALPDLDEALDVAATALGQARAAYEARPTERNYVRLLEAKARFERARADRAERIARLAGSGGRLAVMGAAS